MTSTPSCPVCGSHDNHADTLRWSWCHICGCHWQEAARRAQPAEQDVITAAMSEAGDTVIAVWMNKSTDGKCFAPAAAAVYRAMRAVALPQPTDRQPMIVTTEDYLRKLLTPEQFAQFQATCSYPPTPPMDERTVTLPGGITLKASGYDPDKPPNFIDDSFLGETPPHPPIDEAAEREVDRLANFIRSINGTNEMGAGALAENICGWLNRAKP